MSDRVIYDSALGRQAKVNVIIRNGQWSWPSNHSHYIQDLQAQTNQLSPPSGITDQPYWWDGEEKSFNISNAWQVFRDREMDVSWFQLCWYKSHIPRFSFILWLAIKQKLATLDKVKRWGLTNSDTCVLCNNSPEDHSHLFFACEFSDRIWSHFQAILGGTWNQPSWSDLVEAMALRWRAATQENVLFKLTLAASVYCIWLERNARIYNQAKKDSKQVIKEIEIHLRCKLLSWKNRKLSIHITRALGIG